MVKLLNNNDTVSDAYPSMQYLIQMLYGTPELLQQCQFRYSPFFTCDYELESANAACIAASSSSPISCPFFSSPKSSVMQFL